MVVFFLEAVQGVTGSLRVSLSAGLNQEPFSETPTPRLHCVQDVLVEIIRFFLTLSLLLVTNTHALNYN